MCVGVSFNFSIIITTTEMIKITDKEFISLWNLYPDGNKERTLEILNGIIDEGQSTPEGDKITVKLIHERYKHYLEWWDHTYGRRDKKFVGKDDQRKQLSDWIITGQWNTYHNFESNIKRDDYLFGGKDKIDILTEKVKRFKEKYGKQEDKKAPF